MWFWYSLIALLFWSGSDLFSKIGCADTKDKYSALKMASAVGFVMGAHALYSIIWGGTVINLQIILRYLPVSLLYIVSMLIGYLSLRYIELSVSSPVCNSSGAIVAILTIATVGFYGFKPLHIAAIAVVCVGVILLGVVESTENDELRKARQEKSNYKYTKSALAIILPVIYCLLDALGTFADGYILETMDENSANAAYELTFLLVGICCFVYVKFIKKAQYFPKMQLSKYTGAVCETIGQFAYINALKDSRHIAFSAPIISSYCVLSIFWSRIFLKEKLSLKHYGAIALTVIGIATIGFFDP